VQLEIKDILLLNAGTLLISLMVLLIPSLLVARILPLKAIRFK
jgi:lipoprotein-releasing system permease protein